MKIRKWNVKLKLKVTPPPPHTHCIIGFSGFCRSRCKCATFLQEYDTSQIREETHDKQDIMPEFSLSMKNNIK